MKKWMLMGGFLLMSRAALCERAQPLTDLEAEVETGSIFAVPGGWMAGVVILALIIASITVCVLRGQLKTAQSQSCADAYIREDSLDLEVETDNFLYETVERRKIETENQTDKSESA